MRQFKETPTRKHLSQNWMPDKNILQKIIEASELAPGDTVLEIGTGTGILTQFCAEIAKKVITYEIDPNVQEVAKTNLQELSNIEFILQDILHEQQPLSEVVGGHPYKVIANIPYHITAPIIIKLIENAQGLTTVVLMVQKEIGERMMAPAGGEHYSSFSIFTQYHFKVEFIWKVSRNCFIPPPRVDSAIMKLTPYKKPPVECHNEELFFAIVRAAFQARRKTLRNALSKNPLLKLTTEAVDEALKHAGVSALERGENVSIETYAVLANKLTGFRHTQ